MTLMDILIYELGMDEDEAEEMFQKLMEERRE